MQDTCDDVCFEISCVPQFVESSDGSIYLDRRWVAGTGPWPHTLIDWGLGLLVLTLDATFDTMQQPQTQHLVLLPFAGTPRYRGEECW